MLFFFFSFYVLNCFGGAFYHFRPSPKYLKPPTEFPHTAVRGNCIFRLAAMAHRYPQPHGIPGAFCKLCIAPKPEFCMDFSPPPISSYSHSTPSFAAHVITSSRFPIAHEFVWPEHTYAICQEMWHRTGFDGPKLPGTSSIHVHQPGPGYNTMVSSVCIPNTIPRGRNRVAMASTRELT